MLANDWPTGSVVKRDLDEEIVQAAVADDEARKGLLDGIKDAKTDGDGPGVGRLTALFGEVDRRRRVQTVNNSANEESRSVRCGECGRDLDPRLAASSEEPCPHCGSRKLDIAVSLSDTIKTDDGLDYKVKDSNFNSRRNPRKEYEGHVASKSRG